MNQQDKESMKMNKVLAVILVIFDFQIAWSVTHSKHTYDVTCTLQRSSSSSSPSILLSSLSSSASSFPAGDRSGPHYKSSCKTKYNDSVSSEVTGDDNDGVYCLTFICQCAGLRLRNMATCHQVESPDARISCPCCSEVEAVCTWTEPHTTTTVISRTTTSKGPLFHVFSNDPHESREPVNQMFVIIFIFSGIIFISIFMFLYIYCKLKHCETSDNARSHYFTIVHSFAYAILHQNKTCKAAKKVGKTNVLSHCAVSRPRTVSYNGGELAKDPITEVDEDNVED